MLRKLEVVLHLIVEKSFKYPKTILMVTLVISFFAAIGGLKLKQIVSMVDQLDPNMLSTQNTLATRELFEASSSLGFILRGEQNLTTEKLCQTKKFIRIIQNKYPQVKSAFSGFELRQLSVKGDKAFYSPLLQDPCFEGKSNQLNSLWASPWGHLLTNPSLSDFTVMFDVELKEETSYGTFNPSLIASLLDEIKKEYGAEIPLVGTLTQEYFTMIGLSESKWLNVLILLVFLFGFRFYFGRWRSSMIYGLSLVIASTIVYGMMGWVGHALDPLSVCLFLMLAISSMEDFIFISQKMMSEQDIKEIFKSLALPCFLTSLTTFLAFLTLVLSDLQSIRHFGLWAAIGGMIEWGLTFIFIPALMSVVPFFKKWVNSSKIIGSSFLKRLLYLSSPKWISWASLTVFITALISVNNFKLSQTPTEMFPKDHPFQQSLDYILRDRGWVASIDLVFRKELSEMDRTKVLDMIYSDPIIFKVEGFKDIINFISNTEDALTRSMVEREFKTTDLSRRYVNTQGDERLVLYLKTSNTQKLNELRKKVLNVCSANQCWVSGDFVGFADFSQSLIKTLFESLFLSVLIVSSLVAFLAYSLNYKKEIFILIVSALWGPAVLLSLIYFCGISINFVTCVVASALVGLTGDNAIMFMCYKGKSLDEGIRERGLASIQSALMMAVCSLSFLFSYFEPPQMLGILLSVGFISSLIGDVWLLKGLSKGR